ncbi:MAG TPA: heterodisulfide reductase-related iron-sulfur binding cluster [Pyrinomonadaceae bacterium]|nr:heterodisulfide reductase-related iron-sulfur binding cluster [Pyrinomonadaceae bacterium]
MTDATTQPAAALRAEERKLLACVHCGLCLEACPTYVHTGDECDGPRGRLYLMSAVAGGRVAADSRAFDVHISRCLGCRACESACPAGVEYGQLLEAARSDIARAGARRGMTNRLLRFTLRHVWLHPARLRAAFALARLLRDARLPRLLVRTKLTKFLPRRLALAAALLDASAPDARPAARGVGKRGGARVVVKSGGGETAARALLFEGCVGAGLFARVNEATARVLAANGCAASAPAGQVCCGALHAHAGDLEGARRLARRNVEAFAGDAHAPVVTNAGGCGAMLASYAQLLAHEEDYAERARSFSARVRDVSQQLAATGVREGAAVGGEVTTYDASCHLIHGQRAHDEPLKMLAAIPELRFVPLEGSDVCCGGAGVYNLVETGMSERVLGEKLRHLERAGARVVATGNPGCQMQIGAGARLDGLRLRVCHPVELLDESYRRAGFYDGNETNEDGQG